MRFSLCVTARQTEVEIVELYALALLAAVDIERDYSLANVSPLAEQEPPTASGSANARIGN